MRSYLPSKPGVYLFKNSSGQVIYIGKACSLRDRVRSYFGKQAKNDLKTEMLLEEHDIVDHIVTKTETEAALLEAHLIREHRPKYNILLKDGQPFLYIVFTTEPLPQMLIVRNRKKKGIYFGPFLKKVRARHVFNFLTKTFRLSLCNKKIEQGCLAYHIGTCSGSCRPDFDTDEYRLRLQLAMDVLKGNDKEYLKRIEDKIKKYSLSLEFEKAKRLHEYLKDFSSIFNTLKLRFSPAKYAADIFIAFNPEKSFQEGSAIDVQVQEFLHLKHPVKTVDCFDISHFQSKALVGSCVRFTQGKPDKDKFRRFMIKTLDRQNDCAALQEIVARRYKDKKDWPDLILIDGGKGQLNAVAPLVPEVTCVSLAKKEERLFGQQFPDGVCLDVNKPVGKLFMALRDYAHHFAISYHREKRRKRLKEL